MDRPLHTPEIEAAVRGMLQTHGRVVLAVSGGCDSMALLTAAARVAGAEHRVTVATFDHGTGSVARQGVKVAMRAAAAAGFSFVSQRARSLPRSEAGWREARWRFLHSVAGDLRAAIATAHTREDHLETVVMRILRGAGARGIAGLLPVTEILRPLVNCTRGSVRAYADRLQCEYVDDPSNLDRSFLRNRVRLDLLPAFERVCPAFSADVLELSRQAAALRLEGEAVAAELTSNQADGMVAIPIESVTSLSPTSLAWLWPAILAAAGVVADRRGIARLVTQTTRGRTGAVTPLSGGFEVLQTQREFVVRHAPPRADTEAVIGDNKGTTIGQWRFYPLEVTTIKGDESKWDLWQAALVAGPTYRVRAWKPGDRLQVKPHVPPRRVARFFEDARVSGPERRGWPVVLAGDEVVWIPGIRRGHAATARSGGPHVVYRCEREYSRSET